MISVAIDGPAGAGKSTVAKLLAKRLDFMYINTGAMYRVVTLKALENNIEPDDVQKLCELIDSMDMYFDGNDLIVNGVNTSDKIYSPLISQNVSRYAAISEVRQKLVKVQKYISEKFNVVMDGRDIGTVVLKNAPFKFFLIASPEERARRRYNELVKKNIEVDYDSLLKKIIERDYMDSHREIAPLKKADDAIEIDSTNLSIEQVVLIMEEYITKN
ncbi:cytidylate kinase [Clostridium tepidiprofundi DSM 19306]|uniref:Cytidylate kinase n=1 Tax=Clostridium tepidiprofundi DSM 19306 TaxID=1121338 RepID=A0A151B747_9CLOT|nr:(d)CMP kinase [Clostridium tepidiprofundi]KYH35745.1 cytidylate kinase [Clostridium tepidiprofundi DSM 19306]